LWNSRYERTSGKIFLFCLKVKDWAVRLDGVAPQARELVDAAVKVSLSTVQLIPFPVLELVYCHMVQVDQVAGTEGDDAPYCARQNQQFANTPESDHCQCQAFRIVSVHSWSRNYKIWEPECPQGRIACWTRSLLAIAGRN